MMNEDAANILKMSTITIRCLFDYCKYARLRIIFEAVAFWYAMLQRSLHFAARLSILRQLSAECLKVNNHDA
jgi:hypothetical protein